MEEVIKNREPIEWCRLWWEQANDSAMPRVLLIGDSITAGYHPYVKEFLSRQAHVDMYASSRAVNDPSYRKELDYVLGEYPYQVIHYNNGLHGWHETALSYRQGIQAALDLMRIKQPEAKIILALSTPVTVKNNTQQINNEKDPIIRSRNDIAADLASGRSLAVNDLYALMMGKSEIRNPDGAHYHEAGQRMQAEKVAACIADLL